MAHTGDRPHKTRPGWYMSCNSEQPKPKCTKIHKSPEAKLPELSWTDHPSPIFVLLVSLSSAISQLHNNF